MKPQLERLRNLRLFITTEHPCSYLPGRNTRNLVADPEAVDHGLATQLANLGFRRSGDHLYRPHCHHCDACMSLRIPVWAFQPNRSQRRVQRKNQDLIVSAKTPELDPEHYALFHRYLETRHRDGGMDDFTPEAYRAIIASEWSHTTLYELRTQQRLLAVAVVDELEDGLSSVYTFFDPNEPSRSLGCFTILWQIAEAKRRAKQWLYLGYWIRDCRKMSYKANYKPYEIFHGGRWIASSSPHHHPPTDRSDRIPT